MGYASDGGGEGGKLGFVMGTFRSLRGSEEEFGGCVRRAKVKSPKVGEAPIVESSLALISKETYDPSCDQREFYGSRRNYTQGIHQCTGECRSLVKKSITEAYAQPLGHKI